MKKLKKENGAITIITLVSILFMVSFLISSYILISNKVKAQKDMIEETRKTYESTLTMEEIYNAYFNDSNIIPIYTVEQLLMIGSENKNININGKYYDFNNDENTIYVLMNDIKFKASDYIEQLTDGYWTPVGDRILEYEKLESDSEDIDVSNQFRAKFEGKNNNIEVIYTDSENDEYSVIYSQNSNYCEPEYEVRVIPIGSNEAVLNEAKIVIDDIETELSGESLVKIKRMKNTKVSAYIDDNYNKPEIEILIINPNKINDVKLKLEDKYSTLNINTTPKNAKVTINGEVTRTVTVLKGTTVNYEVSCDGYYSKKESVQLNKTTTINVNLDAWTYSDFSERFYFTRCSNEEYEGMLNGGSATLSKYNLGGADYSMGTFYIDEVDIVKKIPSNANISKVILCFEYYQDRNNTFLYTNRIKTNLSVGTTEKLPYTETENTDTTVREANFEVTNISRRELEEGIAVRVLNYVEGTLTINSTIKNMYCIIEGQKPNI